MYKIITILFVLVFTNTMFSQNVGIGTTTPAEKLHVAGNIYTSGELKPNGVAGQANQVLTSNGNGTMQWAAATATGNSNIGGFGPWGDCSVQNITDLYPVTASDGMNGDNFGFIADISGDYAIVASEGDDYDPNESTGAGSVVFFKRNTSSGIWEEQVKFYDTTPSNGEAFGYSVSISGDYAIVGTYKDDTLSYTDNGSATIFKRNSATGLWAYHSKIYNPILSSYSSFGWSVSIDGDYAIVGSKNETINGVIAAGSACIFKRNTATDVWQLQQKIIHPDYEAGDDFGYSVSINGEYAIVGAPSDDIGAIDNGSASVYKRNASNIWVVLTTLYNGATNYDKFGFKVDISATSLTAIVGAIYDDINGITDCGSVSIFKSITPTTWNLLTTLSNPNATSNNSYGISVGISDDYAVIGDNTDGTNKGKAQIYKRVGNAFVLLEEFVNPYAPNSISYFSQSFAFDPVTKRFVVTAPAMNGQGMAFFGKIK